MNAAVLILISLVLGLLCIRRLRSYDLHEQEPLRSMAAVTLWGGWISILISLFLYRILQESGITIHAGKPFTLFYVGFVEELAKLAALLLSWPIIRKEMNEPADGPIYIACVALGFSLIENYFYALANPDVTFLIAIRLVLCTPMHIAFCLFMGLAFFWVFRCRGSIGLLIGAYLLAGIYHALYDIFVGYIWLLPGLYFILRSAYSWMYNIMGYTAARSPFRHSLSEFIHSVQDPPVEPGLECLDCGSTAPKPTYREGRIAIQHCESCGTFLCTPAVLHRIVHRYGSLFGSLKKHVKKITGNKHMQVLIGGNRINLHKRTACFRLDEFNAVLEETSRSLAERLEQKWWFPFRGESVE